ncbi:5240_t:CDS:1, partial [Ambispora leptoticha]
QGKRKQKTHVYQWCEAAKCTNNIFVTGCDNFKEQSLKRHLENEDYQKILKTHPEA